MQMEEIKKRAKAVGLKAPAGKAKKLELVREVQKAEGNFPCFGTAENYCDRLDCSFREDCLSKNY